MAEQEKQFEPLTDFVMDAEGAWYAAYVEGGGHVKVLAVSAEDAKKILAARYPKAAFTLGFSKRRASAGEPYLKQVPVPVYEDASLVNPKDLAETERRGSVNYEYATR